MKVRCPICDTENRGIAKFCIECVNPLPTALAASGFAKTEFSPPPELSRSPKAVWARMREPKGGAWFSVAGLVLALTVGGAAGWMLAGPGAVYKIETDSRPEEAPVAAATIAVESDAPSKSVEPVEPVEPAPPPPPPPPPEQVQPQPQVQVQVQKVEAAKPVAAVRPVPREAAAPSAACAGLNFIAAARCMAAQCLKPAFKPHPQCEAVRRQQRLEEEKRNPILAN